MNIRFSIIFSVVVSATLLVQSAWSQEKQTDAGASSVTNANSNVTVTVDGGKLTVVFGSGQVKVFDLEELAAQGEESKESKIESGKQQIKVVRLSDLEGAVVAQRGRTQAMIVDQEGNKRVIDLANLGDGQNMMLKFENASPQRVESGNVVRLRGGNDSAHQAAASTASPKAYAVKLAVEDRYMLGITCEPVPDSLRAHLSLEEGVGVLIANVYEGKPASGKLLQFDIVVDINGKPVSSVDDVVAAVKESGENSTPVSIKVRRGNETLDFEIVPERQDLESGTMQLVLNGIAEGGGDGKSSGEGFERFIWSGDARYQLKVLPELAQSGIIIPSVKVEDLRTIGGSDLAEQIAELRQQIEELKSAMNELKK